MAEMEIAFTPAVVHYYTFISILLVVVTVLHKKLIRSSSGGLNLPPGPWALPVIGNLHCLRGALPHHAMRALAQRYGPVMLLRLGHVPTVVVSSPEAAREVLKTHDAVFANRPLNVTMDIFTYSGRNIAFAPYGSRHWKEVRRLCATELLGPKRVLSFRPIREEEAASLVRSVSVTAAASPAVVVNVSERVRVMMNDILMRCAIGDTCPMREQYIQELDKGLELMAGFNLVDLFPGSRLARALGAGAMRAAMEVHHRIHHIMQAIIQHHHANNVHNNGGDGRREDILGVLLRLQKDGDGGGGPAGTILTAEVLSGVLFDLFAAGSETTAATTIWAMSELVRTPDAMRRAQSEVRRVLHRKTRVAEADIQGRLPYLQTVIKETLRLHPPTPLILPRLCSESTEVLGFHVPHGATVYVNVWAIGRDERSWPHADEFRPERFEDSGAVDLNGTDDFKFLPGGGGRRMCPGMAFGMANIEIALASLLYHFDWKLCGGADPRDLDMAESYGITSRRKSPLLLEAVPWVPLPPLMDRKPFGMANIEIALAILLYHFDWKLCGGADPYEMDMAESYGVTVRRKSPLLLEAVPCVPLPPLMDLQNLRSRD